MTTRNLHGAEIILTGSELRDGIAYLDAVSKDEPECEGGYSYRAPETRQWHAVSEGAVVEIGALAWACENDPYYLTIAQRQTYGFSRGIQPDMSDCYHRWCRRWPASKIGDPTEK
jgi:hypothetical protein